MTMETAIEPRLYVADYVGPTDQCRVCGGPVQYRHFPDLPAFEAAGIPIHVTTNTRLCATPTALHDMRVRSIGNPHDPLRRRTSVEDDPIERQICDLIVLPPGSSLTAAVDDTAAIGPVPPGFRDDQPARTTARRVPVMPSAPNNFWTTVWAALIGTSVLLELAAITYAVAYLIVVTRQPSR